MVHKFVHACVNLSTKISVKLLSAMDLGQRASILVSISVHNQTFLPLPSTRRPGDEASTLHIHACNQVAKSTVIPIIELYS